jgi:hypothetical protein
MSDLSNTDIKFTASQKDLIHIGDTPLLKRIGDKWIINALQQSGQWVLGATQQTPSPSPAPSPSPSPSPSPAPSPSPSPTPTPIDPVSLSVPPNFYNRFSSFKRTIVPLESTIQGKVSVYALLKIPENTSDLPPDWVTDGAKDGHIYNLIANENFVLNVSSGKTTCSLQIYNIEHVKTNLDNVEILIKTTDGTLYETTFDLSQHIDRTMFGNLEKNLLVNLRPTKVSNWSIKLVATPIGQLQRHITIPRMKAIDASTSIPNRSIIQLWKEIEMAGEQAFTVKKIEAKYNGASILSIGDVIAAFKTAAFDATQEFVCGVANVTDTGAVTINVVGSDENIFYKLYKGSDLPIGPMVFNKDEIYTLVLDGLHGDATTPTVLSFGKFRHILDTVGYQGGYTEFSFNVVPNDGLGIANVFGLNPEGRIKGLANQTGAAYWTGSDWMYTGTMNLNTGALDVTTFYTVKLQDTVSSVSIEFSGVPSNNVQVTVEAGYSWIGIPQRDAIVVNDYVNSFINLSEIYNRTQFWYKNDVSLSSNNLDTLHPKQGYVVKSLTNSTISFADVTVGVPTLALSYEGSVVLGNNNLPVKITKTSGSWDVEINNEAEVDATSDTGYTFAKWWADVVPDTVDLTITLDDVVWSITKFKVYFGFTEAGVNGYIDADLMRLIATENDIGGTSTSQTTTLLARYGDNPNKLPTFFF